MQRSITVDESRYIYDVGSEETSKEIIPRNILGEGYIKEIKSGLLSYEEIIELSVYDVSENSGDPSSIDNILLGARNNNPCGTCGSDYSECRGHMGRMMVPEGSEFLHPYYVNTGIAAAVMNIFCYDCFRNSNPASRFTTILFSDDQIEEHRLNYVGYEGVVQVKCLAEQAKKNKCINGHSPAPFAKAQSENIIIQKGKKVGAKEHPDTIVSPSILRLYLRAITEHLDLFDRHEFLGFGKTNYESLVVRAIIVIPPRNRPETIIHEKATKSDLTKVYIAMLKYIHEIKLLGDEEKNSTKLDEPRRNLRNAFFKLISGDAETKIGGVMSSNKNIPFNNIKHLMDKKKGLRLHNAVSARVNNAGRTVIIGNNNIKPTEAIIPKYMAEKFRIEIKVTAENLTLLNEMVNKEIIKGYIEQETGTRFEITREKYITTKLSVGDTAFRRLLTGDAVLINRQPTLHRWNVIMLKAVVIENPGPEEQEMNSIGLNTGVVSGLNADFDGDEAHVHVPDSIQSRAEAAYLMAVDRTPVNEKNSVNLFTLIQNSVWGAYNMTKEPKNIPKETWYRYTQTIQTFEGAPESHKFVLEERIAYLERTIPRIYMREGITDLSIYNTMSLISLALPPDFSYRDMIIDGVLVRGTMVKSITGAGEGSIIRHLFESHGATAINVYVHVMQQVIAAWMSENAHTLSVLDFCPSDELKPQIEDLKETRLLKIKITAQRNVNGIFNHDEYFQLVNDVLKGKKFKPTYIPLLTPELRDDFIMVSAYRLFDVLQASRNRFFRALSQNLYDESMIEISLKQSADVVLKLPDMTAEKVRQGTLVSLMKLKKQPGYEEKIKKMADMKKHIVDILVPEVKIFVDQSIISPFDVKNIICGTEIERATYEADTMDQLEELSNEGKKLLADTGVQSSLEDMVYSGARGTGDQLSKSKVLVGQQTMNNGRLEPKISGGTRVNPFFLMHDPDPRALGFVRESLYEGVSPAGWLASAMPSRQTQMDTAFKTGDNGYMQKQLMANCGDYVVRSDGTIRDERDNIISFSVGGHFMDPSRMIKRGDVFSVVDCQELYVQLKSEQESTMKTQREYFKKW